MMPGSTWSRGGLAGIIAFISAIIVALILHFGLLHGKKYNFSPDLIVSDGELCIPSSFYGFVSGNKYIV